MGALIAAGCQLGRLLAWAPSGIGACWCLLACWLLLALSQWARHDHGHWPYRAMASKRRAMAGCGVRGPFSRFSRSSLRQLVLAVLARAADRWDDRAMKPHRLPISNDFKPCQCGKRECVGHVVIALLTRPHRPDHPVWLARFLYPLNPTVDGTGGTYILCVVRVSLKTTEFGYRAVRHKRDPRACPQDRR